MSKKSITSVEQLKSLVNLEATVGKYVHLIQKGNRLIGICPFHKEKTPSFTVTNDFYYCFGCHKTGDIINFIQEYYNLTFIDSIKKLAEDNGLSVNFVTKDSEFQAKNQRQYDILLSTKEYYINTLKNNKKSEQWEYLINKRKLSENIINTFEIGFSSSTKNSLFKYLTDCGYSKKEILSSGVIKEFGSFYNDFFENRITIPIKDTAGRTVGFGGRVIKSETVAKYINSQESDLFKKKDILYNYARAKQSRQKDKNVKIIITEGYIDVITMAQFGFDGGIAPLGTSITEQQIKGALNIDNEVYFCFNSDTAGKNASFRAAKIVSTIIFTTKILPRFINIHPFKDIDELLNSGPNSVIIFNNAISNAKYLNEFLFDFVFSEIDIKNVNDISKAEDRIIQIVETIPNKIVRKNYIRFFKNKIFELSKKPNKEKYKNTATKIIDVSEIEKKIIVQIPTQIIEIERRLIALFIICPDLHKNENIGIENIVDNFTEDGKLCYYAIVEENVDNIPNSDFLKLVKNISKSIELNTSYIQSEQKTYYYTLLLEKMIHQYILYRIENDIIDIEVIQNERLEILSKINEIDNLINKICSY